MDTVSKRNVASCVAAARVVAALHPDSPDGRNHNPTAKPRRARRAWLLSGFAAAALVTGASAWVAYSRDIHAAEASIRGRSIVIQSPYGPIEYAIAGRGAPLLAIHGSGGGFDQGLAMLGPLERYGYKVIAPSRFGYLRSGRPENASPEVQADALAWLVSRLGYEKVVVAGGSAGALAALQFAIRHPDKTQAVVLLAPAAYSPQRKANQNAMGGPVGERVVLASLRSNFLFWAATKLFPDQMTRAVLATEPKLLESAGPQEQARVKAILAGILPVSRRAKGLVDDTRWAGAPPRYPLERIAAPLLAVSMKDDLYGTYPAAEYTAASVKEGRFVGYPTGGHVWVGRDPKIWEDVVRFLKDIGSE